MKVYILLFFVAAAATYLLVPVVRQIAVSQRFLTPVRERDIHTQPVPRLGGVAITGGLLTALGVADAIPYLQPVFANGQGRAIALAAAAISLLGVIDDLWDLDWMAKLAGQILIASGMAYGGVQLVSFPVFGLTIGSPRLSLIATVLIVVVCINAVNFVDGLDGLAAGVIAIGAAGFFTYAYMLVRITGERSYASLAAVVTVVLVGVCLGFLPHNFHPASIFMGDSGAMVLGLVSAASAIIITGQVDPSQLGRSQLVAAIMPIILPIAVLTLPLADMVIVVIRRLAAGKSPFHADRLHLHHRLLEASGSHRRAVLLMYLLAGVVSLASASLVILRWKIVAWALVPVMLGVLAIFLAVLPGLRARFLAMLGPSYRPEHSRQRRNNER